MNESLHLVETENGGRIALYRLHVEKLTGLPVIIAHGTISNADTVRTLGKFLPVGKNTNLRDCCCNGQSVVLPRLQK